MAPHKRIIRYQYPNKPVFQYPYRMVYIGTVYFFLLLFLAGKAVKMGGGSTKQCGALFCLTFCRLFYLIRKDKTAKAKTFGDRGSSDKGFVINLKILTFWRQCAPPLNLLTGLPKLPGC
jgi:hypothetical protein